MIRDNRAPKPASPARPNGLSGRTGRYLLYAIGEIILVMIGILLALQVNNWNTQRIENEAEKKVLVELRKGILSDAQQMKQSLSLIRFQIEKMKLLKLQLQNKDQVYTKSLDTLFGSVYGIQEIRINKAFYEDLKASSLRLIKDDDIRLNIVNLFEDNYVSLDKIFNMELHINDITRPYYLQNFHDIDFLKTATPNDFATVWNDSYYENIVHYRTINLEANHVDAYISTIPKIKDLAESIKIYLE